MNEIIQGFEIAIFILILFAIISFFLVGQHFLRCPKCGFNNLKYTQAESKNVIEQKYSFHQNVNGGYTSKFEAADFEMICKRCGHKWKKRSLSYY